MDADEGTRLARLWAENGARLDAFAHAKLSFDPTRTTELTAENGWRIDDYEIELPPETPGAPVDGGSFETAVEIVRAYRFPPPELITGIYAPDGPLEGRRMLLRARFLAFTFWFAVEIGGVVNEVRPLKDGGGDERVFGYHYGTLEGHFERGQIAFSVHKQLANGRVFFRIHAYSQPEHIENPFYRVGFKIFGRGLQRRFAEQSLQRVRFLVRAAPLTHHRSEAAAHATDEAEATVRPPSAEPPRG